ncbi:hypothetical protein [Caballeronia grimmiae]|uniref:Uncharacterized protein n=1 Tax=Caballeronia grimmiae TaxID=1071679 RepID=A0A069NBA7_9BURK|nr:hypothetical protein [Caballeronia grimmiae]KDR25402.1 hypothetical protein BG57_30640 [Caballeronia grimmiae]GGD98186.1 hypothetical protein GCM10010985_61170 [Caballeronia grimmiae]
MKEEDEVPLDDLLKKNPTDQGEIALFARTMQHRTNKVMDSLSNRLLMLVRSADALVGRSDKALEWADQNAVAQSKQQVTMSRLTWAIALSTILYTGVTAFSTWITWKNSNTPQVVLVHSSGPVPESAAVHMGVDEKGTPAVCVNGTAYDVPASSDQRLKERPQAERADGAIMPVLRCRN